MKIDGNTIRAAINVVNEKIMMLEAEFENSKFRFDDEDKRPLAEIGRDLEMREKQRVQLQTAQQIYNGNVTVQVQDDVMHLSSAIKLQGPTGRMKKNWKSLLVGGRRSSWDRDSSKIRNANEVMAAPNFTRVMAEEKVGHYADLAYALTKAIIIGNATVIEIDISEDLLKV